MDGVLYIAANTCGDAACALHAVLGKAEPAHHYCLFATDARGRVVRNVPENAFDVCKLFEGKLKEKFLILMDSVWKNLILPTARAGIERREPPSREASIAWSQLDEDLRERVVEFVAQRLQEERHHKTLSTALQDFARSFFKPECEAEVIRPLCVLLGYLKSTDAALDLLKEAPAAALLHNEGEHGALELLHPCLEKPGRTKYQVLFDPSPHYDRYRLAFFANAKHSRHDQQKWLLHAFETLAGEIEADAAQRLRKGHSIVAEHCDCYGSLEHPPAWNADVAWGVLRKAILDDSFWLSPEELQLFSACCKIGVHVYRFIGADAHGLESIGDDFYCNLQEMETYRHVAFESGAADSERGHFSRLFTEKDWLAEAFRVDANGSNASDEISSSSTSGGEDDTSSADGEVEPPSDNEHRGEGKQCGQGSKADSNTDAAVDDLD